MTNDYGQTFADQLKHPETIFVKKRRGRHLKNVPLNKLTSKDAIEHIRKWLENGQIPTRIKVDG